VGAVIGGILGGIAGFFEALFGGSSDNPATPRQLLHGRHPLYPVILGVQDGLIPTEASEGPVAENRAPSNTPSALLRPLSNSEVFVIENIPIGGPSEGLLETKYGAGKLASVTTDLVVHELTGRLEADFVAGVLADLLVQRYYQPPNPLAFSALRIAGFGGALSGGTRLSDYRRAYRFLLP
jgi:hypothetical protein